MTDLATTLRGRLANAGRPLPPVDLEPIRLALDPELRDAKARWLEGELEAKADRAARRRGEGRKSGWQRGTPQCHACRRILNAYGGWCPDCRTHSDRHLG